MSSVVPTITAENPHTYREQIERVHGFASRIHIDLMDGVFTPNKSLTPQQLWWPEGMAADIHIMFQQPYEALKHLVTIKPQLIIVPAEATFDLNEVQQLFKGSGVSFGLALLPQTAVESASSLINAADHVLIFSGNLGYQGGSQADLELLNKLAEVRAIKYDIEIGWDGGVDDTNVKALAEAGVDIINSGGFIHKAEDSALAYQSLTALLP